MPVLTEVVDMSDKIKKNRLIRAYSTILENAVPSDVLKDENFKETAVRAAESFIELTSGYTKNPTDFVKVFPNKKYSQIIAVKDIPYFSLCAHHLLPFYGKISIAVIPDQNVLGLSKYARIALMYARRLQIQEQLTEEIADEIVKQSAPKAAAVLVTGTHLCMQMRGVQSDGVTETSSLRGLFLHEPETRAELFQIFKDK